MQLTGKKTYIVGVAMLCYAIGGAVSKRVDIPTAIETILIALGMLGLRHGISTEMLFSYKMNNTPQENTPK